MPANLPPPYFEAEKRYRQAKTPAAKIEALEEMLTIMPKHKGTDKLRADLRRRIAKCKNQAQQKKGAGKREDAYFIDKEGAAQVVVIGAPNVGKSTLLATLTNATPETAPFPHTTWKPTPGMAAYENVRFQLVDTPPITRQFIDSWMADLIRRSDLVLLMVDLSADPLEQLEDTRQVLARLRIFPSDQPLPRDLTKRPFVKKFVLAANKMDSKEDEGDYEAFLELSETTLPAVGISALNGRNLQQLLKTIYQRADIIRVYSKAPGKEPDHSSPFILPRNSTLEAFAAKVHKDFATRFKFAKIWGTAVYDGQMVQRDYVLRDQDVVELHI